MAVTALLDNDVLTNLASNDQAELQRLAAWLNAGNGIAIPRIVRYEFRRGVLCGAVDRPADQRGRLFLAQFVLVEIDDATWETAADIWAAMYKAGAKSRRRDHDILIAATAITGGFEVATHNKSDFEAIRRVRPGLTLAAW